MKRSTKVILILIIWFVIALILFLGVRYHTENGFLFKIAKVISSVLFFPCPFFIFVIIFIKYWSKKTGEGDPLSLEAMKYAKKSIPNEIYKFISLGTKENRENSLDIKKINTLSDNNVWFSRREYLNDPFEGVDYIFPSEAEIQNFKLDKQVMENLYKLKEEMKTKSRYYAQSSFSTDYHSSMMWGYYANGCRGFCACYKVKNKDFLFKAIYTAKRFVFAGIGVTNNAKSVKKNLTKIDNIFRNISDKEFIQYMLYLQSFKNIEWKWENEIRAIDYGTYSKIGYTQSIKDIGIEISKIIIGYRCEYMDDLIEIAKNLKVPYSIMQPSYNNDRFLLFEKIDNR